MAGNVPAIRIPFASELMQRRLLRAAAACYRGRLLQGGDASLNAPIRDDGESGEWMDWLVSDAPSQERLLADHEESDNRHQALIGALGVLNERERRIFEARRLADDPITLEDLATEFGVSRERVRQIEVRAFEKVQKAVRNSVAAMEQPTPAISTTMH